MRKGIFNGKYEQKAFGIYAGLQGRVDFFDLFEYEEDFFSTEHYLNEKTVNFEENEFIIKQ